MFRKIVFPAVAASFLMAAPVFAQPAPGVAAPPPPAAVHQHGWAQHRLQALHDRLGITAAQQPQWDAVVATLRDDMRMMRASPAVQALREHQVSGVARLRAAADAAHGRADAMGRLIPKVEALYAVLSPAQQQVANQTIDHLIAPHHRRRG